MSNRRKKHGRRRRRVKAIRARAKREEKARIEAQSKVYHLQADIFSFQDETSVTIRADSAEELSRQFYWSKPRDFRRCLIDGHACSPEYFFNFLEEQKVRAAIREIRYLIPNELIERCGIVDRGDHLVVNNPPGKAAFEKMFEKLGEYPIERLYHGTPAVLVPNILSEGFHLSTGGALGRGLYLGPMRKAVNYTGGNRWKFRYLRRHSGYVANCGWSDEQFQRLCRDTVLECDVLIGRCNKTDRGLVGYTSPEKAGFDTLYYDGFQNPEYCVRSTDQVLIKRIILVPKRIMTRM